MDVPVTIKIRGQIDNHLYWPLKNALDENLIDQLGFGLYWPSRAVFHLLGLHLEGQSARPAIWQLYEDLPPE